MDNIRHTAFAAIGALIISTACVLGAVGPVRAATPDHSIELRDDRNATQLDAGRSL